MARIGLFDPCYLGALRPSDVAHARRVLEMLGDEVEVIDGRCCGQPAFNSGFREQARSVGLEFLRAAKEFDVVVTASGSCSSMIHHYLPGLFPGTKADGAARIAARVQEFTAYVLAHPGLDSVIFRLPGVVAYHDSCHYRRELRATETALALLARVEELDVRRLTHEAECCGFGGTFAAKLPEVSAEMLAAKLNDVAASGARVVVSTDFSCLAHMESGDRADGGQLETWTIAELLARALG